MTEKSNITVFLMGASLIEDYGEAKLPLCGWGKYFPQYVKEGITVKNYAHSGWSTKSFLTPDFGKLYPGKSCWDVLIDDVKENDWVLMFCGVNDASLVNDMRTTEEEYCQNLTFITEEIRKKGADIIFSTLSIRGGDDNSELGWNYTLAPEGKEPDMDERWIRRSNVLRKLASALNVELIELGLTMQSVYENMYKEYMNEHPDSTAIDGRNYVRYYFHLYNKPINTPVESGGYGHNLPEWKDDSTHLSYKGACAYAHNVAKLISKTNTELARYINP